MTDAELVEALISCRLAWGHWAVHGVLLGAIALGLPPEAVESDTLEATFRGLVKVHDEHYRSDLLWYGKQSANHQHWRRLWKHATRRLVEHDRIEQTRTWGPLEER